MGTLGAAGRAAAGGVVAALAAAGCGSTVATLARAAPSIMAVNERGAVPWVDLPGHVARGTLGFVSAGPFRLA